MVLGQLEFNDIAINGFILSYKKFINLFISESNTSFLNEVSGETTMPRARFFFRDYIYLQWLSFKKSVA